MGLFNLLNKKKAVLPVPPPPASASSWKSDVAPIRSSDSLPILPDLPKFDGAAFLSKPVKQESFELPELPVVRPESLPMKFDLPKISEPVVSKPIPSLPTLPVVKSADKAEILLKEFNTAVREKEVKAQQVVKPVFVAVEDYKKIVSDTNSVQAKLLDADKYVSRLSEIRGEEQKEFERWRSVLERLEKKLGFVDQMIAKAQG